MRKVFILVVLALITIFSCEKNNQSNLEKANRSNYIFKHTEGKIMPDEIINISYKAPVVPKNKINQIADQVGFEIKPKVDGKLIWHSRNTLNFIPEHKFEKGQEYEISLDNSKLFPNKTDNENFSFKFKTFEQQIMKFKSDFEFNNQDEKIVRIKGSIEFRLPVSLEDIEKNSSLKIGNKTYEINWKLSSANKFMFRSSKMKRMPKQEIIKFSIKKDELDLKEDFIEEMTLHSMHKMEIMLVKRLHKNDNPAIEIKFSGNLDLNQDISEYFYISGIPNLKIKKFKNKAILNGNFKYGKVYELSIRAGIKNYFGVKLENDYNKKITFNDEAPRIVFTEAGCFLPTTKNKKIEFKSINFKKVRVEINKIYDNNVTYFLQYNGLLSNTNQYDYTDELSRFGEEAYTGELEISNERNKWQVSQLDLSKLIKDQDHSLYIIRLIGEKENANYRGYSGDIDYYSDPNNYWYYPENCRIVKPLILNNLALTAKKHQDGINIVATDILKGKPAGNCKISVKSYQNQILEAGTTDKNGMVNFKLKDPEDAFIVEGEYKGMQSIIRLDEMKWNLSSFDVEGVVGTESTRAFIYTERGVYRPGDKINMSMIFRNGKTFPANHPVKITITNPQRQKYTEKVLKNGINGFYNFSFKTEQADQTGTWTAKIEVGAKTFFYDIKIETVVAERIKITFKTDKEEASYKDKELKIDLEAKYLFGAPASNLKTTVECDLISYEKKFKNPKLKSYNFYNNTIDYNRNTFKLFNSNLDDKGKAAFDFNIPDLANSPSAIMAKFKVEVNEKGGRSSKKSFYRKINPYSHYIGIKEDDRLYVKPNRALDIGLVVSDDQGNIAGNQDVILKVYRNKTYWWWSFNYSTSKKYNFISSTETELVYSKKIKSDGKEMNIEYTPETRGQYLITATHLKNDKDQHTSSRFLYCSDWYADRDNMENAGVLDLKADKDRYEIGNIARINFPTPPNSKVLVSIEKGNKILKSYWQDGNKSPVEFKITEEMYPNVYCNISVIQPYEQQDNDRPLRTYGIISLPVSSKNSKQKIELKTKDILKPNEKFKCKVKINEKSNFTIAVVDEGLLSLTNFQTPNPWQFFNMKQRLDVETSDNYNYIIGNTKFDVFKTFAIGGGMFSKSNYRKDQTALQKSKRFKPVCMFKGPLQTDDNGFAEIDFTMPEYMGAVRVMVISAKDDHYGYAEKTIEVKNDIVLLPTFPRTIAPDDIFQIPVEIFATSENIGKVKVKLISDKFIKNLSDNEKTIELVGKEQKRVIFKVKTEKMIGISHLKVIAESSKNKVESNVEIAIRPLSARISKTISQNLKPGETTTFSVPQDGVTGSNYLVLSINKLPKADFGNRLNWLIRYPYGCIEQTVSSVFPQLYLKNFFKNKIYPEERITQNINEAIARLNKFQLTSGAFTYWPSNDSHISVWGSSYAANFLLLAKEQGYHVPDYFIKRWKKYAIRQAKVYNYNKKDYNRVKYLDQLYRVYLLAQTDYSPIGILNYIRENHLNELTDVEKWLLAASYKISGSEDIAEVIVNNTGVEVLDYTELRGNFGNAMRDKAIILDAMVQLNLEKDAEKIYFDIAERISEKKWYSTQTTAYALMAMGKYLNKYTSKNIDESEIFAELKFKDGQIEKLNLKDFVNRKALTSAANKSFELKILPKTDLKKVYASLYWSGVPLKSNLENNHKGIKTKVTWKSIDNELIDPTQLKQGTVFKQVIEVENITTKDLKNIAMIQVLPSGWEIVNERLNADQYSQNNNIDYLDLRDDRAMWFFDLRKYKKFTLELKLRAVTVGEFYQPGSQCEAMYDNRYKSTLKGQSIKIISE